MIKELLDEEEVKAATEICNKILSDDVTPEYIVEVIDNLDGITYTIMPRDYIHYGLASGKSILIDDILEMDSISDEEKQEAINRLILRNKDNFTNLAKDLLEKVKSDQEEATKSGYCRELMKHREG